MKTASGKQTPGALDSIAAVDDITGRVLADPSDPFDQPEAPQGAPQAPRPEARKEQIAKQLKPLIPPAPGSPGGMFPTTRWTLVLAANHATEVSARKALSELCEMYWFPLYAFARSYGCTPHDAEDATQGFFFDFLERDDLSKADESKGKLRDFLRVAMRNFLNKGRRKAKAERRGGRVLHISIDQQSAEGRYNLEPVDALSPDVVFERHWVITLFKHVLDRLENEYAGKGKAELFHALKGSLSLDSPDRDYSEVAARLGITKGSARVTACRMKERYRQILEEEIAHTVASSDQVEDEVNHLLTLFQ